MVDALTTVAPAHADRTERRVAFWVAAVFVGSNIYYFHRYAFRYSSSQTSPTYVDTPWAWRSGKFVLVFVATLAAWLSVWWTVRTPGRRPWSAWRDLDVRPTGGFAPLLVVFVGYGVLITAVGLSPSNDNLGDVVGTWFFLPVVLLITLAALGRPSFVMYGWAGLGLVAYHLVFSALQLVWFVVFDRLPALAYSDGLTRFGGGLDDPNGFGVMATLPLLIGVSMWSSWPKQRIVAGVLVALGGLLFLALSFSATIGCIVGFLALAVITRRTGLLAAIGATLAVGVAIGSVWSYTRTVISDKMESAMGRFDFGGSDTELGVADFFGDIDVVTLLFGDAGVGYNSENSYLLLLTDFGVIGVGFVLALTVIAVRRGVAVSRSARAVGYLDLARLYEALVAFLVAFAVASLGVPYFEVFPVNMLFWIVAALAATGPNVVGPSDDGSVAGGASRPTLTPWRSRTSPIRPRNS